MPDFHLVERRTSTDSRDGGASWDRVLGVSDDGEGLKTLAVRLSAYAWKGREDFHAGPADRSFEDRCAARDAQEARIREWFDVSLAGDEVSFHVVQVAEHPRIDLSRLSA